MRRSARTPVAPSSEGTDAESAPPATRTRTFGLSGTHLVRILLLTPIAVFFITLFALRHVHLQPSMYAVPVRFYYTDAGSTITVLILFLGIPAHFMSHLLEAGRRCKLPVPKQDNGQTQDITGKITAALRNSFSWQLNARSMAVWDTFDCVETFIITACVAGGYIVWTLEQETVEQFAPKFAREPDSVYLTRHTIGYSLVPPVVAFVFKRVLLAITANKHEHMPAFVIGTAVPITALVLCFQLYLLFVYANSGLSYPYSSDRRFAMAKLLAEGNNSLVRCDDEMAFWNTFQLDCDHKLCGYRTWTDLCQAWRFSFVARSTNWLVYQITVAVIILLFIAAGLAGSGRIARTATGELDLKGLLAPHILLILGFTTAYFLITLDGLAIFFLQAPMLLQGTAPADPLAGCGPDTICWFCAYHLVGLLCACGAVFLLPIDTLKRVLVRYNHRQRTYFLSYKQNDGNDGAVLMLANILRTDPDLVWLDKYAADRSETGMVEGVTSKDIFVAILSEKYFESRFCCLELRTALRIGKPILVVWNQSKFTVQTALKWIQEQPQPELAELLQSEWLARQTQCLPALRPTLLHADELLPIQEDIQMAGTCASRIKAARVKPNRPLELDAIGKNTFGSIEPLGTVAVQ